MWHIRAAIHQRVKKMEDSVLSKVPCFIVKPDALGFGVCAFLSGLSLTTLTPTRLS